jgi:hypothetical protein
LYLHKERFTLRTNIRMFEVKRSMNDEGRIIEDER